MADSLVEMSDSEDESQEVMTPAELVTKLEEVSRSWQESLLLVVQQWYLANTETYLKSVALKHMPPNLQAVDLGKSVQKPNLDSFVFLRVKQRQDNILVEPETDEQREYAIDLEEGSQHLMRYRTIAPLVASGAVQLI
ncbi:UNVERIFIED_CONTAM: hypothetical protein FKN15_074849 [Acipenser sinensis]